jgi:hypothetical protein
MSVSPNTTAQCPSTRSCWPRSGLQPKFADREKGWAGWMSPGVDRPLFLIGLPFDRRPATAGNGQMVALLACDRATVDRCPCPGTGQRWQ